ncbi:MAG TPA: hypothetical protein VME92_08560 [Acetobacteraceae bacterium]|nr:hypothetical protein [Acetobacteraceae bacterium]
MIEDANSGILANSKFGYWWKVTDKGFQIAELIQARMQPSTLQAPMGFVGPRTA